MALGSSEVSVDLGLGDLLFILQQHSKHNATQGRMRRAPSFMSMSTGAACVPHVLLKGQKTGKMCVRREYTLNDTVIAYETQNIRGNETDERCIEMEVLANAN